MRFPNEPSVLCRIVGPRKAKGYCPALAAVALMFASGGHAATVLVDQTATCNGGVPSVQPLNFPNYTGQVHVRRRPVAAAQIELDDPVRVAHWCRELGVTWLELIIATDRVGPNAVAVRNALRARDHWWGGRARKA